ncbi:MAG: trypsin-like peptidase domain-containing protein [Burkholderiales bacterium]|nr:trypsin-like peptidase domain-containing protein [Burkholderiales bacterium]
MFRIVRLAVATIGVFALLTGIASADREDAIAKIKPSVVAIGTLDLTRSPAFSFRGTGFAVGDGKLIATNAHVLPSTLNTERRETLAVALPSATGGAAVSMAAQIVAVDREMDLALLAIDGKPLPAVALAPAGSKVREGQNVLFTGFPIGGVIGIIPATHRAMVSAVTPLAIPRNTAGELDAAAIRRLSATPPTVIQLDGTAYPGNSGSPLYDDTGMVVGVINMVFVKGSRENAISQPSGIGYAIPIQALQDLLAKRPR